MSPHEVEPITVVILLEHVATAFVDIESPEIRSLQPVYLERIAGRILFQIHQLLLQFFLHRLGQLIVI